MHFRRRTLFESLLAWFAPGNSAAQAAPPAGHRPGALGGYILPGKEEVLTRSFDVVIVGGGIAGTCAAIAAARNGARTALVHERSTLGGNSSSEVRLYPEVSCAHNIWCKETGILDEIHVEERVRNHEPYVEGLMNSVWDLVLYEWAVREKRMSLFLNTTVREVEMKDAATILAVHGYQMGTERKFLFTAPLFVDATGDGVLGYRAGAEYRWGMEGRAEFQESNAPVEASARPQMGNTLFFRARDAGVPVPFRAPEWAAQFPAEEDLVGRDHESFDRGYWWLEVGLPLDQIRNNEEIRHETLRQLIGVWDHIKNRCVRKDRARNYGLDFVSFWPYKREARRLLGDHILTQSDLQDPPVHTDAIAFGCWYIDIHKPGGILSRSKPNTRPPWEEANTTPYGIPLRSCYSRNVTNLLMAGRPISASYVAFSSTRVLRTGAIVGQGVGTAAALCAKHRCLPRELARTHHEELRRTLLLQDAFLPGHANEDPRDLARAATVTASSEAPLEFPETGAPQFFALKIPAAQLFPVSGKRIDSVELLLKSDRDTAVELRLGLRPAEFVYDLRPQPDIAQAVATVPARSTGYVRFQLGRDVAPVKLYVVHVPAVAGVSWALFSDAMDEPALSPTGCTAAELPGPTRWHPLTRGRHFGLRVSPTQFPYGPRNAVAGTNRPDRWPNIYVSHPASGFPAWLELQLPSARRISTVQITFDTDMNRHTRRRLFRYPDCVKRYEVLVARSGGWQRIAGEDDNYMRRRVLTFPALTADRVRVAVHETNGGRSARIYEVRLYSEPDGVIG
ncbi:MAG: FAD-dependent oxidoreductase [Acidobacteria bacterium]|nr:FAD-dependent oxidoreductase [Acidobacteriota bacterium]